MRIVRVWITAICIIFTVGVSWYVTLPGIIGVARALNESYYEDSNARNIATAVEYASYAWGPLLIGFVLLWAGVSSSRYDAESEVYR